MSDPNAVLSRSELIQIISGVIIAVLSWWTRRETRSTRRKAGRVEMEVADLKRLVNGLTPSPFQENGTYPKEEITKAGRPPK